MLSNSRKRACSGSSRRRLGQARQALADLRDDLGDVGRARPELGAQRLRIAVVDVVADHLDPGPVGRRALPFVAAAPEHLRAAQRGVGRQFLGQPGLADARFAGQQQHLAAARTSAPSSAARSCVQFPLAPDEDAAGQPVERVGARWRCRSSLGGRVRPAELARSSASVGAHLGGAGRPLRAGPSPAGAGSASPAACGTRGLCQVGATGAVLTCWLMIATGSSPRNGGRPVDHLVEHRARASRDRERASGARPIACSGGM